MTDQERLEWLNGFLTRQDFKEMGMKVKRSWLKLRRWQVSNLCRYALNEPMLYSTDSTYPYKDQLLVS